MGKILNKGNKPDDELMEMKNKIEKLEKQLGASVYQSQEADRKKSQYEAARQKFKEKFGIDLDEVKPEMENFFKESNGNPYLAWGTAAARERLTNQAKEDGIKEGKKLAYEEFLRKVDDTPAVSSGSAASGRQKFSNTRDAVAAVFAKKLQGM